MVWDNRIPTDTSRFQPIVSSSSSSRNSAAFRAHAPWAVHTLELDSAPGLRAVRIWPKPDRKDARFTSSGSRNRGLFLCAALTGLRIGEILALRWQDIDFQTGKLSVAHSSHRSF